ncbi:MAG: hypothetical protein PHU16_06500 [Atribacterota bacterium]|nr:hypothetical protein [Atribacterota bacterium]
MRALLSIKPKYIEEIAKGNKKYEFRKQIFKRRVKEVLMYATAPSKKIVGVFAIKSIIKDSPKNLWNKCKKYSGIEKKEFFDYFGDTEVGYAIEIGETEFFNKPLDPWDIILNFSAPQSYRYLSDFGGIIHSWMDPSQTVIHQYRWVEDKLMKKSITPSQRHLRSL